MEDATSVEGITTVQLGFRRDNVVAIAKLKAACPDGKEDRSLRPFAPAYWALRETSSITEYGRGRRTMRFNTIDVPAAPIQEKAILSTSFLDGPKSARCVPAISTGTPNITGYATLSAPDIVAVKRRFSWK